MAKKRRRTHTRPRTQGAVGTAEREAGEGRDGGGAPGGSRGPGPASRTRAEKKDMARRQREEIRKRVQRAERARRMLWISTIAVVVAVGVAVLANRGGGDGGSSSGPLPGILRTDAPWPANSDQAAERADAIGLPGEGSTMHIHAGIEVFVHGEQEAVPANIGIDTGSGDVQSLHTHDATGTVHMESASARQFKLGEFFDVWGVRLTATCVGGYCNDGSSTLRVFKDGDPVDGSIRDVVLDDQSVIVVTYGTRQELPDPIPTTFDFGPQ